MKLTTNSEGKTSITAGIVIVYAECRHTNTFGLQPVMGITQDGSSMFSFFCGKHAVTLNDATRDLKAGDVLVIKTPHFKLPLPLCEFDRQIILQTALLRAGYLCVSYVSPPTDEKFAIIKAALPRAFGADADGAMEKHMSGELGPVAVLPVPPDEPASPPKPKPKATRPPPEPTDLSRN